MRTSDRVESVVRTVLIAIIVAAAPVSVWLAMSTSANLSAQSRATPVYSVQATVDADAGDLHVPFNDISVPVHWSVNGLTHSGMAQDGLAHKNDQITVLVGPDGAQASPRVVNDEIALKALKAGMTVFGIAALAVMTLWRGMSEFLGMQRRAQWSREWEIAAPRNRKPSR